MSESDTNIVQAFRQLQRFCHEVDLLLAAADSQMAQHGWTAPNGVAFADVTRSLNTSANWLPQYFARFYTHPTYPSHLVFVSVIVDETPEPQLVQQALVSGGWFEYGPNGPGDQWWYWFSKAHLWAKDRSDDGRLCNADFSKWTKDFRLAKADVRQLMTFALPLSQITDAESLQRLVTQPLVDAIDQISK